MASQDDAQAESEAAVAPDDMELADTKDPLLTIDEAIERIPAALVKEMHDLLRAEFREVRRWTPPKVGP